MTAHHIRARTGIDTEAMDVPAPGTCDAVQAAAARWRQAQAQRDEWAEGLVARVGSVEANKLAVTLLDAAARRHGNHPDTLRRAGL